MAPPSRPVTQGSDHPPGGSSALAGPRIHGHPGRRTLVQASAVLHASEELRSVSRTSVWVTGFRCARESSGQALRPDPCTDGPALQNMTTPPGGMTKLSSLGVIHRGPGAVPAASRLSSGRRDPSGGPIGTGHSTRSARIVPSRGTVLAHPCGERSSRPIQTRSGPSPKPCPTCVTPVTTSA